LWWFNKLSFSVFIKRLNLFIHNISTKKIPCKKLPFYKNKAHDH
jgi:hypothetical protein